MTISISAYHIVQRHKELAEIFGNMQDSTVVYCDKLDAQTYTLFILLLFGVRNFIVLFAV